MGAQPIGQLLDLGRTGLAALGDDDVGPELAGQRRAVLMAGEGDDPLGPQGLGGQDGAQAHRAVADDGDRLAGAGLGGHGRDTARDAVDTPAAMRMPM